MFDTTLKCVKIDEYKQFEQQAAYYNGNIANNVNNEEIKSWQQRF